MVRDHEYCTPEEAADRLGVDLGQVWRLLEQGDLPALLIGELRSRDGAPIGFDYALLPPEGVRRVLHHGGHGIDEIEWTYAFGNAKATGLARKESIRVLWEPSLFADLVSSEPRRMPPAAAQPVAGAPGEIGARSVELSAEDPLAPCDRLVVTHRTVEDEAEGQSATPQPFHEEDAAWQKERWTPELRKQAREMRARFKSEGHRDYTRRTASHYGVSATLLTRKIGPLTSKPAASALQGWPNSSRGRSRSR